MKKIIFWTAVVFLAIQFIPVDRENKAVVKQDNFVDIHKTPDHIKTILKNACYDCHSNETVYPDYAYVAPISWSIKNHISEGREHLNFSEWGNYNQDLKKSMLQNSLHSVKDYSMPSAGYIAQHPEANLTAAERTLLANYFENILKTNNY